MTVLEFAAYSKQEYSYFASELFVIFALWPHLKLFQVPICCFGADHTA